MASRANKLNRLHCTINLEVLGFQHEGKSNDDKGSLFYSVFEDNPARKKPCFCLTTDLVTHSANMPRASRFNSSPLGSAVSPPSLWQAPSPAYKAARARPRWVRWTGSRATAAYPLSSIVPPPSLHFHNLCSALQRRFLGAVRVG